ncbi:hypothetical protein NDU88_007268 [Pleurodeles waltl]|uniref:Uncharacterized protein n=1 Tax=Pleurodeles waltl TaxID=8319 RepID=A0AAV7NSQ4_PLEWA|nr:hypothetical protein NDU88_007268 [Pleurodeles waltl]
MSGDGRRLPAQCSPDGALVPPEIRCPVSDLPVSRAQTPSSMPKCRCEQDVKRALCRALRDMAPLGEGAPQAEESQRRRCTSGRAAPGAPRAPVPHQQPRPS